MVLKDIVLYTCIKVLIYQVGLLEVKNPGCHLTHVQGSGKKKNNNFHRKRILDITPRNHARLA
jgi:hypothetical protein